MDRKPGTTFSIKKRLILLLGCVAIGISGASYVLINSVVSQTVVATQDRLLSAAIASIVDNLYSEDGEVSLDLPYDTFSLLGAIGEDQVFYKISEKNTVITGYVDLPKIANPGNVLNPSFKQFQYRGKAIRLAAVNYPLIINGQTKIITILVAQTMNFQDITLQKISKNFIPIVIIFTLTLVLLALGAANLITNPLNEFATKVQRRGPNDLRKIIQVVPEEVIPLVEAFNDLLKKLRGTLRQTETFIAEAAHHIRTPLAVVKSESELALRKSRTPENREHLRQIIRSVDQTNRSATQLLDHAMVLYRAERPDKTGVMINNCMAGLLQQLAPAAALKDILIKVNDETTGEIFMEVDRNLFETAIRNLLDNAVKYSPVEKQICVNYSATKHHYKIEIKNERIGVKSLNFRGLLKRFKRGSNAAEVPGSGLGLSIANEAIMALKGDLKIFQSRGNTICATVSLPFS